MKVLILLGCFFIWQINTHVVYSTWYATVNIKQQKLDIKIKNDTTDDKEVINASSGGHYKLTKNVITTLKMNVGDKLYLLVKGKKGNLLLTASKDIAINVQLYSQLIK